MRRRFDVHLFAAGFAVAVAGCGAPTGRPPDTSGRAVALDSARTRASYMVGLDLARQVKPIADEVDVDVVVQALRTAYANEPPLLDDAQVGTVRREFTAHLREQRETALKALAAKNAAAGEAFLQENARKPGVRTTASGLQYEVLQDAAGPKPNADDTVDVSYVGMLPDGRTFENTYVTGHSTSFPLDRVIPGLAEAIRLMPMGSKYRFWMPGRLAYGEHGRGAEIEPNQRLTFEIELLAIAGQPGGHPLGD